MDQLGALAGSIFLVASASLFVFGAVSGWMALRQARGADVDDVPVEPHHKLVGQL